MKRVFRNSVVVFMAVFMIVSCAKKDEEVICATTDLKDLELAVDSTAASISMAATQEVEGKKFVRKADVDMDVSDVYQATIYIENTLKEMGGFVTSSNYRSDVLEENVFPLSRASEDEDELEEERRLAYVGITRAEKVLYLTNANSRMLYGKTNYNQPTRFLREISSDLLDYQGLARPANSSFKVSYTNSDTSQFGQGMSLAQALQERKRQAAPSSISTGSLPFGRSNQSQPPKPEVAWAIGDIAHHKKWGDGSVLAVSGSGNSQELKINFPEVGLKKVLASIAPIEKKS